VREQKPIKAETCEEIVARIREKVQAALLRPKARKMIAPRPPRYDEVFFEGVRWLDSL